MQIDYQLPSFNVRQLLNNGHVTRVLFESQHHTFACEIIGPTYHQQPLCDFKINTDNHLLKQDIYNILQYIVFTQTYPKQLFTIYVEGNPPPHKVYNALFYAIILHGIRIKDSFTSMHASLQNKQLSFEKEGSCALDIVYCVNEKKIIQSSMRGKFENDDYQQLLSGCISGCQQVYDFLKE